MSLVGYSPEYIEFANARRAYGMALNMRPSKRKDALVAERWRTVEMARAALQNLLDRRKSARKNPGRPIIKVRVSSISPGDVVLLDGRERTVCAKDIKRGGLLGTTLFGDSYRAGRDLVPVVMYTRALPGGKTARSNPIPDPVYHGVKVLPPAKAADGDTVVVPSQYKPGKFEVLIYGGDIVGGRYQEMWIYVGAYDKAEAIAKAKEAAA